MQKPPRTMIQYNFEEAISNLDNLQVELQALSRMRSLPARAREHLDTMLELVGALNSNLSIITDISTDRLFGEVNEKGQRRVRPERA